MCVYVVNVYGFRLEHSYSFHWSVITAVHRVFFVHENINSDKSATTNSVGSYNPKCSDVLNVLKFSVSTNLLFSKCLFIFLPWLLCNEKVQNRT